VKRTNINFIISSIKVNIMSREELKDVIRSAKINADLECSCSNPSTESLVARKILTYIYEAL
jgi:hypothetical protein